MKNGLYAVDFKTPLGAGAGVIHLQDGKAVGGDSGLYYFGDYQVSGDSFKATIQTDRHGSHEMKSVFGTDKVTINLEGNFSGDTAKLTGSSPMAPGITFQASLRALAA